MHDLEVKSDIPARIGPSFKSTALSLSDELAQAKLDATLMVTMTRRSAALRDIIID